MTGFQTRVVKLMKYENRIWTAILLAGLGSFVLLYADLFSGRKMFTHDAIMVFGSFQYYLDSMLSGFFPYWDPYMQTGTYFYPNVSVLGLLDPAALVTLFAVKPLGVSPFAAYHMFRLIRLVIFFVGCYQLFKVVSGQKIGALLAALILMFCIAPGYFHHSSVDLIEFTPLAMWALIRFFEQEKASQRYRYLFLLTLFTGITFNIFIPAYFLFNAVMFVLVLFALGVFRLPALRAILQERKSVLSLVVAAVLVACMAAPPVAVWLKDASRGGELFPMHRVTQKSGGKYKKILATEVGNEALSGQFSGELGTYSSYGNMASMLYPDVLVSMRYFEKNGFLAEVDQYLGMIPFLVALLGFFYHTSRYRYVAAVMLLIITLNMFNFTFMVGKPNWVQHMFNALFPPLKMIDVRQSFSAYFLLYMGILLSLGFSILLDGERIAELITKRYRALLSLCIGIVILKFGITGYYGDALFFASSYDAYLIVQLIVVALLLYAVRRRHFPLKVAGSVLAILIAGDLAWYSLYSSGNVLMDKDNGPHYQMSLSGYAAGQPREFQNFREPLVSPEFVTFGESILKAKGAITYPQNHGFFTTKRYYDLLTNLPPDRFLDLSSITSPIIRFYPMTKAFSGSKTEVLQLFEQQAGLPAEWLALERPNATTGVGFQKIHPLQEYEDVLWLSPENVHRFVLGYLASRQPQLLEREQKQLEQGSGISVLDFNPNRLSVQIDARERGFLYVGDGYSKYWKAYDGDREIPVLIANYNAKAVYLEPGTHHIRFVFDPVHYRVALLLYYLGLCFTVSLVIYYARKQQAD